MRIYRNTVIVLSTLLLSACAVGPNYVRPSAPVPVKFKEAKGKEVMGRRYAQNKGWKVCEPQDDIVRGKWWRIFDDIKLDELEAQLDIANQSIITAEANYRNARALVDEARAAYFPTLTGAVTLTRQKQSSGSTFFSSSSGGTVSTGTATTGGSGSGSGSGASGSGGGGSSSRISVVHTILLQATWEPDIWGLVRRQVEAASAGAQSSAALVAVTRLSSQASLAQFYFELRGLDTDQQLLDDTVRDYKKSLQLTRNQYASGVVSRADVLQAQSLLEVAQAAAINNGILRGQYEHAIAVLIGVPPADLSLSPHPLRRSPPPIPLEVPSALLERRPDIAQAERLIAQANAEIGVAIAAYFPALTISGSVSAVGQNFSNWFSLPTLGWAYGPQLSQIFYNGGLREAQVAAARAMYEANVASYRQVVLAAFQDVEDNLVALRILGHESIPLDQAARDARKAVRLVINQYKAGTVDYASVITAQVNAYAAEKNAADNVYLRMTAAVGLIKALGGGWDDSHIADAATQKV